VICWFSLWFVVLAVCIVASERNKVVFCVVAAGRWWHLRCVPCRNFLLVASYSSEYLLTHSSRSYCSECNALSVLYSMYCRVGISLKMEYKRGFSSLGLYQEQATSKGC